MLYPLDGGRDEVDGQRKKGEMTLGGAHAAERLKCRSISSSPIYSGSTKIDQLRAQPSTYFLSHYFVEKLFIPQSAYLQHSE
mmetsp:Transcript_28111/g.67715  ORF Transcript_28111/g.67715 Transcript_28111/m.67715 type:complete len:82 (+) Transcript_28111:190-435(+)